MTNYLLSYDISDTKTRTRLAKILLKHGCERLQKSVFIAPNFLAEELRNLRYQVQQHLLGRLEPQDSFICTPVSPQQLKDLLWEGDQLEWKRRYEQVLHWLV